MNNDDKLKEFLKKNDSVDYSAPVSEFEQIHEKAIKRPWFFYLIPVLATAVLVLFLSSGEFQKEQKIQSSDDDLEDFIVETMIDSTLEIEDDLEYE